MLPNAHFADRPAKILVVEDELFVALDIETLLLTHGYAVLGPASTIDAALTLLDAELPDVALLDFNINGETVILVADRLRGFGIPIVLTSAYEIGHLNTLEPFEGALFVSKPFDSRDLLKAVAASL